MSTASSLSAPMVSSKVKVDRQYGAVLEGRWVPAPRFVLRRNRVLPIVEGMATGRVLEVGCGSGALLRELAQRGHECIGLETSPDARALAKQMLADSPMARVQPEPEAEWDETFDLLMSFEVLEHIEDDRSALKQWVRWLKPGGRVILSMPAHMTKWSEHDAWAGHVRRYGKQDMIALAQDCGLQVEKLECYGFPLSNVTHWLDTRAVRGRSLAGGATTQDAATANSGTDRTTAIRFFPLQQSLVGRAIMHTACQIQKPFLGTTLGDGYLLVARRPAHG